MKRCIPFCAAFVLTVLIGPANAFAANPVDLGTFTYPTATSLGSVNDYAAFAQNYNKLNHMEGTIAANYLTTGSDAFGVTANVDQYVNKSDEFLYFAHITGLAKMASTNDDNAGRTWNTILPDDVTFDTTVNHGNGIGLSHTEDGATVSTEFNTKAELGKTINHVSDTTYQIDFAKAFSALSTYASTQYAKADTGVQVTKKNGAGVNENNYEIDVVCNAGDDIVNLTLAEATSCKLVVTGNNTTAYSLTVNVTDVNTTAQTFDKAVTVDGSASAYGAEGGKLLWNFGTSACRVTFNQTLEGVVLAPGGSVTVTSSHNGSVFADTVENNGCEIHQNGFKPQGTTPSPAVSPTSATLAVTKAVSGSAFAGGTFGFTLAAIDGAPLPATTTASATASSAASGTATFDAITYTTAGTYYYAITEDAPASPVAGMTYDTTARYAKVVVSASGTSLSAAVTYGTTQDACTATSLSVTNTYAPTTSTKFKVSFQKVDAGDHSLSLTGCKLCVMSTDGKTTYGDSWYSVASQPHEVELGAGYYNLVELEAPEGYEATTPVAFTVNADGTVSSKQMDSNGDVLIWDEKTPTASTTDNGSSSDAATSAAKASTAKTSDLLQPWMFAVLAAVVVLAIVLLLVAKRKSKRSVGDASIDARAYATQQQMPQKQTRRNHQRDGEVSVPRAGQPRHQADESDAPRGKHTRR